MEPVKHIVTSLEAWANPDLAASWDNVGLQIGDPDAEVKDVLIALEVDETVLETLVEKKNVLVVTHHPLFFKPLRYIRYDQDMGRIISAFTAGRHHLFSAHTNLDAAQGGVNDCLIEHYGLNANEGRFIMDGFGKWFVQPSVTYEVLKSVFSCTQQGAVSDEPVKRLGFCAGSGHGLIKDVVDLKCDTFITGEITYHDHVTCRMNGVRVLTLGHRESEVVVLDRIRTYLEGVFGGLQLRVLS